MHEATASKPTAGSSDGAWRLRVCDSLWGTASIRPGEPPVTLAEDVVFTPFRFGGRWGVFDLQGLPVPGSVDRREPSNMFNHQVPKLDVDPAQVPAAPAGEYIYAGRFNNHYGHFLVETMPRLWWLTREKLAGRKLVLHGDGDPEFWFGYDFSRTLFNALGLSPDDFVHFADPVAIASLVVPHVSLQQQTFGYPVFRDLMRTIGWRLLLGLELKLEPRPVYLSKTRLTGGVGVVGNEGELEQELGKNGVEIVYPELLSMVEQVKLFATRRTVLGTAGSAFHTAIMAPPVGRHLILNPIPEINANYRLFDLLNEVDATYYFAEGTHLAPSDARFLTVRQFDDPTRVARALLDLI